ncbi:DNA-3-methyladenine glycosylase [Lactiplantibacillus sp. WILCCON 0030]|uniref:Putative 3-methyladenine DNA glycosylase n=1 Tax=Lactiplantibacillus brownii TaxID=3069269 RepID=A0ABU1ACZ8_9LACO|nr:DNA-3-methyladenine glycosylase [Lactiplantibacillus brownii]MDQ7938520.1 DNA-3-methyladenine glycosylase [Lactiplantibacillus brownii]
MTKLSYATAEDFTGRPTTEIAQALLGTTLLYRTPTITVGGLIVEAEAYLGKHDTAAHAFNGRRSAFSEPLYRGPGTLYIYRLRANYLLDIVTQPAETPEGILIRAIEPSLAPAQMIANRGKNGVLVSNGPGKLMQALGIQDQAMNLMPINDSDLAIDLGHRKTPRKILALPRVGVNPDAASGQLPLRFVVAGNPYLSDIKKRDWQDDHGWKA